MIVGIGRIASAALSKGYVRSRLEGVIDVPEVRMAARGRNAPAERRRAELARLAFCNATENAGINCKIRIVRFFNRSRASTSKRQRLPPRHAVLLTGDGSFALFSLRARPSARRCV